MKYIVNSICNVLIVLLLINVIYSIYNANFNYKNITINSVDNNPSKLITNTNYLSYYRKYYNNSDIVGIMEIPSINMITLLTQTTNNTYYLDHLVNKEKSKLGNTFIDYRTNINSNKKLIIYGHHSKKHDIPFNNLVNYINQEYCQNNQYIKLTTNNESSIYKIFSVYKTKEDFSYLNIYFANTADYINHLKYLENKSIYKTNTPIANANLLILQTCLNDSDKNYFIIGAIKMGGKNEKDNNHS